MKVTVLWDSAPRSVLELYQEHAASISGGSVAKYLYNFVDKELWGKVTM
jgi:hypothetical protein